MNKFELRDVSVSYETPVRRIDLLSNLSYAVKPGEYCLIEGRSGSGKSTILNLLAGFVLPTSGVVLFDGADINKMNEVEKARFRNTKIGFIYQAFNLIDSFNVLENVTVPLLIRKDSVKAAERRASELIDRVGLSQRIGHFPHQLSGGEQQRVAIARALACDPDVILADEPTGNLDKKTADEVLQLLDDVHSHGKTIVMATHDTSINCRADRIIDLSTLK